jgi:putative two-component system response regulator
VGVLLRELVKRGLYADTLHGLNLALMEQSAQLHDVGKIKVPDSILQKPGKLTPEEFEIIKEHASFGEEVIEKIQQSTSEQEFLDHAKIFAGAHHEKWDGSGYPRGLKGENIPLQGRVMAIADVYDALVSDRPYKKAFSHEEAVGIIMDGKGKHFDPQLADVFFDVSDTFRAIAAASGEKS